MKNLLFTKRQLTLAAAFLGLLLALIIYAQCGGSAHAADMKGEFFLPLQLSYAQQFGAGTGVGWQHRKSGVMLTGLLTYTHVDGVSGTTPYRVGCTTYQVPFHTGNVGVMGGAVTVSIPIRSKR